MHRRRAATLALALLLAVPLTPASAADPSASPAPTPSAEPSVPPPGDPSPDPALEPSESPSGGPSAEPSVVPSDEPSAEPAAGDASPEASPVGDPPGKGQANGRARGQGERAGGLDTTDRYIVVLRTGADVAAATERAARGAAVRAERTFQRAARGYAAVLDAGQLAAVQADPDVVAVVPDEIIRVEAQYLPMGIRRINGTRSAIARIDGVDQRVDADVAIVDTGIDGTHPDLNVVGGYNCSTSDRTAWRDVHAHGTHVAGIVGAKDNGDGVVGVAPGVRLWAVKILNDEGYGYLSWYVCGLDWIAAQRDPDDASRPLFEAVNMSVAKSGRDDGNCGNSNADILHQAICRLYATNVTIVAAAGNDSTAASTLVPASYNEVITVSALADTDGKAGGLGGNLCYSWGGYDQDDTLADFSNYGYDVDLIAPGKCIWSTLPGNRYGYMSGTSMATPHVAGAVALYKASRPLATPGQVKSALITLGTHDWNLASDKDAYPEKLLDVSRIVALGDFTVDAESPAQAVTESGATVVVPVTVVRSEGFFEAVSLSVSAPSAFNAVLSASQLAGEGASDATVRLTVPAGTRPGRYDVVVTGRNWDRVRTATATVTVEGDAPTAYAPLLAVAASTTFNTSRMTVRAIWPAATDDTSPIDRYEVQWSVDGGAWGGTVSVPASTRSVARTMSTGHLYAARVRARDTSGQWSAWAAVAAPYRYLLYQEGNIAVKRTGTWIRYVSSAASGGAARYATARGAAVTLEYYGRGFALVMPKGPTRGWATVYIDGAVAGTINLYRSSTINRQVVFTRAWPTAGTHTVRVVVAGTAGRPRVDLDAIVVLR